MAKTMTVQLFPVVLGDCFRLNGKTYQYSTTFTEEEQLHVYEETLQAMGIDAVGIYWEDTYSAGINPDSLTKDNDLNSQIIAVAVRAVALEKKLRFTRENK